LQPLGERRRKWPAQIRAAQFGSENAPAAHHAREAAPDRLDLGKLGHLSDAVPLNRRAMARAALSRLSSCPMNGKDSSAETDFGFRRIPEAEKGPRVRSLFDSVAFRYDVMNDLMSGGIHRLWKAEMVASLKPRPGQRLVDVAGGTGDVALRALPSLKPESGSGGAVVCDVSERMLAIGRARAIDRGLLAGVAWLCADAERLPFADRSFDLYTIAFGLRSVTRIAVALAEARRVLKPGGRFLALEFAPQVSPPLQPLYDLYSFAVVPLLGQVVTGEGEAYRYLVESIRRFPRQGALAEMITDAGFGRVKFRNLSGGVAALHSAWRL
jgi:demethylmenaquinone methyltransferase / 2-methoxy-6-polyprenyl-1,4-benzoquinol methylase